MFQWMGGARRKIGATKDSKLKRQREFFDHRKEKQRRTESVEESRKPHTLADYIQQNLHGGESLDILGLRNLNPTAADACTTENPDVNFPDHPANAAVGPNSCDLEDLAVVTSNMSAFPNGALKEDAQIISSQQSERTTRSRRIFEDSKKQNPDCTQWTTGVAATAQQKVKKHINRNTGIPVPANLRNPIHVGNLQTKKVCSTAPRLKHFDTISNDVPGGNRGTTRSPSEDYAVFSQEEFYAIDESAFDPVVENSQQMFNFSHSDAYLVDTKQLHTPSLQLKNSSESHLESSAPETSELLSRFLSTQKLKVLEQEDELVNKPSGSQQHERWQLTHNETTDLPYEAHSLPNSVKAANECHNLDFSNPTFNMINVQVKQEPSEIDFSNEKFVIEDFPVKQEFIFSDPFLNTMKYQEYSQENERLNFGSNISDHRMTQDCQYLADLSYDEPAFKVDSKSFDLREGLECPNKDPTTWYCGTPLSAALTAPNSKGEFPFLDHLKLTKIPSSVGSQNKDLCQSGSYELEDEEFATAKFDNLQFPVDELEFEGQQTEAAFFSLDLHSPSQMKRNQCNFGSESPVCYDDLVGKNCTITERWNCESSVPWDALHQQEIFDPAISGKNLGQMHDLNDDNSWYHIAAGKDLLDGLKQDIEQHLSADHFSDCSSVEVNVIKVFGAVQSTSGKEQDINKLPFEVQANKMCLETVDSPKGGKDTTTAKTTSITKLLLEDKDLACDTTLTKDCHKFRNCYPLLPISLRSLRKETEVLSWKIELEPQREVCSELLQTPNTRISSSNLLPTERGKIEDSPTHRRSSVEMNHSPSKELFEHSIRNEIIHNVEEDSLEIYTLFKALPQEDINGMSTTEGGLLRKQLRQEDSHDFHGRTPFSSQEECSPEFQLRKVHTVLCKLQRPTDSRSSKQGEVPDQGAGNVNTVLLKFQRPAEPSHSGPGLQDPESNRSAEKNVKQTSDVDQMINSELGTKPNVECGIRLLTDFNIHDSRGSLTLPHGGSCCVERSVSKPNNSCLNEDVEIKVQSEISKHMRKENRSSLHHIDTIASTDHWVPDELHQNANEEKAHSPLSVLQIKEGPKLCASPVEKQNSTSISQRNSTSLKPEKNHLSLGVTDPPAREEKQHSPPEVRRIAELIVPDEERSFLGVSDAPVTHTGALKFYSNTPQVFERQEIIELAHEQHDRTNIQRNPPPTQDVKQDAGSTTYDAAYVKMLESYVVQLKLENNVLRFSSGS
nr:uncharacterized protein LOC112295483 isoform X4 [Physcomitrium patens]|eukprot:XP_024402931.1 uncharacterized protein LOC112295483 isoform X4 [Physcomitrella patens]